MDGFFFKKKRDWIESTRGKRHGKKQKNKKKKKNCLEIQQPAHDSVPQNKKEREKKKRKKQE